MRNRNTTGELIKLSIRAVSMERSFFCESRSLIGKGPVGKAKRARGWKSSEHMSQKTYKKKASRSIGRELSVPFEDAACLPVSLS